LDIEIYPIFLGGVLVYTGNTPPTSRVDEGHYVLMDTDRVSRRFGVDTRSPPGHPLQTTSLNIIRFLRALLEEEGQDTLIKCTRLIFYEFYNVQTDHRTDKFWECLIPTLTKENLARIRKLSQTTRHKEGVKEDVKSAVEMHGMYGAPWFVAKRPTDGKEDVFFGADKFEAMGWWLGPEYIWKGPYPDGQECTSITTPARRPDVQFRL